MEAKDCVPGTKVKIPKTKNSIKGSNYEQFLEEYHSQLIGEPYFTIGEMHGADVEVWTKYRYFQYYFLPSDLEPYKDITPEEDHKAGVEVIAALDTLSLPEDPINPSHYQGKEVFNQMLSLYGVEAVKGFCLCNAYKYRMRAGKKEGNSVEQDIKKALWYEHELTQLENGTAKQ